MEAVNNGIISSMSQQLIRVRIQGRVDRDFFDKSLYYYYHCIIMVLLLLSFVLFNNPICPAELVQMHTPWLDCISFTHEEALLNGWKAMLSAILPPGTKQYRPI
jgi:hypothetical protein